MSAYLVIFSAVLLSSCSKKPDCEPMDDEILKMSIIDELSEDLKILRPSNAKSKDEKDRIREGVVLSEELFWLINSNCYEMNIEENCVKLNVTVENVLLDNTRRDRYAVARVRMASEYDGSYSIGQFEDYYIYDTAEIELRMNLCGAVESIHYGITSIG